MGLDAISIRMYSDFPSLWEGWTKNWFLGLNSNILKSISASVIVFIIFSVPWIILFILFILLLGGDISIDLVTVTTLVCLSIFIQFYIRYWCKQKFNMPMKHWYLVWLGGIIISLIGISSTWKTITGYGWTLKGRKLA